MRIIATYKEPKWYFYRKLVGINTYANRSEPDGFETQTLYCTSLEELKSSISRLTHYINHQDPGRPMRLSDLSIKIEEC